MTIIDHNILDISCNVFFVFIQEWLQLLAQIASLTPEEIKARKEALKRQQKQQLEDYDDLTKQLVARAERSLVPKLDIEHTYARLGLREQQLKELANAVGGLLGPEAALLAQYKQDAARAEEEAREYRKNMLAKAQVQ